MSLIDTVLNKESSVKEFDNVTRIILKNDVYIIETDVHDLFLKNEFKKIKLVLSYFNKEDADYIMTGYIFKHSNNETFISYGGLLMSINKKIGSINEKVYAQFYY